MQLSSNFTRRISDCSSLRQVLSVVRVEHQGFHAGPALVAKTFSRCGKLAIGLGVEGIHSDDVEAFRVLSQAMEREARYMIPNDVENALVAAGRLLHGGDEILPARSISAL